MFFSCITLNHFQWHLRETPFQQPPITPLFICLAILKISLPCSLVYSNFSSATIITAQTVCLDVLFAARYYFTSFPLPPTLQNMIFLTNSLTDIAIPSPDFLTKILPLCPTGELLGGFEESGFSKPPRLCQNHLA